MNWTMIARWVVTPALIVMVALVPIACTGSDPEPTTADPGATTKSTTTSTTTSTTPPSSLDTGFESGTAAELTAHAGARVTRQAARNGSFGFDERANGSEAYGRFDAGADGTDRPWWSFRAWVRIVSWTDGESVDLFTVRNLGVKNNFDLFVATAERAFQWDLFRENTARTGSPVELGRWYLVEARGSFASDTYTAEVRIDGIAQTPISSPGQPPSAVSELVLGSLGVAKTHQVQYDDVRFAAGERPIELFGPPDVQS